MIFRFLVSISFLLSPFLKIAYFCEVIFIKTAKTQYLISKYLTVDYFSGTEECLNIIL